MVMRINNPQSLKLYSVPIIAHHFEDEWTNDVSVSYTSMLYNYSPMYRVDWYRH